MSTKWQLKAMSDLQLGEVISRQLRRKETVKDVFNRVCPARRASDIPMEYARWVRAYNLFTDDLRKKQNRQKREASKARRARLLGAGG